MKLTPRQRSARKAARTRAANRAMIKRWREVDEPARRRTEGLINHLLKEHGCDINLLFVPQAGRKLKNGARYGKLVKFLSGGNIWRVLPDGYKQPRDYHPGFWEVLL